MELCKNWRDPWPGLEPDDFKRALMDWLQKEGQNIEGTVLHAGSGVDAFRYFQFFPKATRYVNLDRRDQLNVDVVADIQNMSQIPSEIEDCILCVSTLYQVPDVNAALKEFRRVLKNGGIFLGEFTAPGWQNKTEGLNRWTLDEAIAVVSKYFKIESTAQYAQNGVAVTHFIRGRKE
jgi:ubiquinone/menaquinone biosynthesis C-methylase UbiE